MGRPASGDGQRRVVIEGVAPEIDGGRFPIKRVVGEDVVVEAVVFSDGHDVVACRLLHRDASASDLREVEMTPIGNDRWRAGFAVREVGRARYTIVAWIDRYATWRRGTLRKAEAGQDVRVDLLGGSALIEEAAKNASDDIASILRARARALENGRAEALSELLDAELSRLMVRHLPRLHEVRYPRELEVVVDRVRARFSAWYELFPRSASMEAGRHGTLADVVDLLPYVREMGFDTLYLPPIHPIGHTYRKGKNNALTAEPSDVGSPWAIGAEEGGHDAIHSALGTEDDLRALMEAARGHGLELALDLAWQCSPDHPYVREHPEWFKKRADGTVQYAENPPKKYQDIYPLDFECDAWESLWNELLRVVMHWVDLGLRIFRVDNPHTKPFRFWEWLIGEVKAREPDVLFLSEAFTRPKVMYQLAKRGFTQSYNYFPWKNTRWELVQYYTELTRTQVREYLRPSSWPNTPDILTEYLQYGGRPALVVRLLLAATLSANYGIYGPPFELCEVRAREPGSEEYLDSEKYQIRQWDLLQDHSLRHLIARVNKVRRENAALQHDWLLRFHPTTNEQLICFSKRAPAEDNLVVVVANLDPRHVHTGWVELPLEELGLPEHLPYQMHDLLGDSRFLWTGSKNFVELDPQVLPVHVFRVRRRVRSEQDFDYFF